jgi:proteasome lid subunit RPN8/RPN11
MVVEIPKFLNDKLISICEEGFPNEVCGVLIGKIINNNYKISTSMACKNLNEKRSTDRYVLNQKDYIKADKEARKQNLDIIGIYHSHPNHPAIASDTDKRLAQERYIYLIYSIYKKKYTNLLGWILNEEEDKMEGAKIEIL